MRSKVLIGLIALVVALGVCAQVGHAFGLFNVKVAVTQAAVAYTDSSESASFTLNTLDVEQWDRY